MKPTTKLESLYHEYPRQYWLMIAGIVLATAGGSLVWPFMLIYASGKLELPLGKVAPLISINAGTGLLASLIAGSLADKIGRKVVMNFSLTMTGLVYFLLMRAETYAEFVGLMIMIGFSNPLYQVGADAMLADMIPTEKRVDAYAINRIANNAAFALGPALGGFLATRSYNLAFYGAGSGFVIYSVLLFFLAHETLNKQNIQRFSLRNMLAPLKPFYAPLGRKSPPRERATAAGVEGYGRVFQDRNYMLFGLTSTLGLFLLNRVSVPRRTPLTQP